MTKHEKLTIAVLAVLLVISLGLLFRPEPSQDPKVGQPVPVITNDDVNTEAQNGQ